MSDKDQQDLIAWMKRLDIPITRENFIDANWGEDVPDPWTSEEEVQIPVELQDWSKVKGFEEDEDEV